MLIMYHNSAIEVCDVYLWESLSIFRIYLSNWTILLVRKRELHCVKVYKYGVFYGPYFPVFRLNTGIYGVFSPNTRKCGPEKIPYLDTFYAVWICKSQTPASTLWRKKKWFVYFNGLMDCPYLFQKQSAVTFWSGKCLSLYFPKRNLFHPSNTFHHPFLWIITVGMQKQCFADVLQNRCS